jgi:hypothetical protein
MSPAKRTYEPHIFEGRVMLPEEQEQIYEEIIQFERMEYVSPQSCRRTRTKTSSVKKPIRVLTGLRKPAGA